MSSSTPGMKGSKRSQADSGPSMLEAHIYTHASPVERIMFDPTNYGSAGKRNFELQEEVEKLKETIEKDSAKKGDSMKL